MIPNHWALKYCALYENWQWKENNEISGMCIT